MIWPFKKTDPLVARLLDDYNLNLLSPPRQHYAVGDLCMASGNMCQRIGSITTFLVPPFELPAVKHEKLAAISGEVTGSIDASAGFDLLGPFLQLIGAAGFDSIRNAFGQKGKSTIQFRFPNTRRDFIDPIAFAKAIAERQFDTANPLYNASHRYYAASGVLRSGSIAIVSADDFVNTVEAGVGAAALGKVSVNRKGGKGSASEITFTSAKQTLAYGVQLFELSRDNEGKWSLGNAGRFKVRGAGRQVGFRPPAYASLPGRDGDLGVEISG
jgi:hypothetical protein